MRVRRALAAAVVVLLTACARDEPRAGGATPSPRGTSAPRPGTAAVTPSPSTPTPSAPAPSAPAPSPSPTRRAPPPAPATTAAPPPPGPATCEVGPQAPPGEPIAANYPTALAVAPDGRLFFAERSGTIRVRQDGGTRVFASVDTVTTEAGGGYSERGLLGLAISPGFAADRFVYALYADTDRAHMDVVRWTDCAGSGRDRTLLLQLPAGSDCCHKGGRIAFGPGGKLFVSVGDEHVARAAQDTADLRGKILRYNPDGSVPADNPFGPGNPVWAFGFRNPFGLAISPAGQVAVTNNGPTGDAGSPGSGYDTVVAAVAAGGGYQWPLCYGYSHPIGGSCGGQAEPDWSSETATVVPTGAAFVDAAGPPAYAGHLVFCTLGEGMKVLTPGTPHATVGAGPGGCRLDVVQAPDHGVYYADTTRIWRDPPAG